MKKPKREELVRQIVEEIGLTSEKKTEGYFTRSQLLDLLTGVRSLKNELDTLSAGAKHNVRLEKSSSN